jgi:hypothetical protein
MNGAAEVGANRRLMIGAIVLLKHFKEKLFV